MVARWLALLLLVVLIAPARAVTEQDQTEIDLGKQITAAFEKKVTLSHNEAERAHLQAIVDKIAPATGRDLPYHVSIVEADPVNAITFPGGYIYVFRGLLRLHPNDDQLAGVLGHEMAHAVFSHGYKKFQELILYQHAKEKLQHTRLAALAGPADIMNELLLRGVGRRKEEEADYYGVRFAAKAGYDPRGLLQVLEAFLRLEKSQPGLLENLVSTHPPTRERIIRVRQELDTMGVSPDPRAVGRGG